MGCYGIFCVAEHLAPLGPGGLGLENFFWILMKLILIYTMIYFYFLQFTKIFKAFRKNDCLRSTVLIMTSNGYEQILSW